MSRLKLIMLLMLLALLPSVAFSQSIKSLWKKAELAQKEGKPQTVIEITENILDKAITSGKTDEALKAFMWYFKNRAAISTDSIAVDIARLEKWVENTNDVADKAVLHSVLAKVLLHNDWYLVAYPDDEEDTEFDESEDHEVGDKKAQRNEYVSKPKEANRWDEKAFKEKVLYHINASLENTELLAKTKNSRYKAIVEKGWYSKAYRHDLLNLLMSRATSLYERYLNLDNIASNAGKGKYVYDKIISTYKRLGNEEAMVATMIMKADDYNRSVEDRIKELRNIVDKYGKYECCGYAMLKIVEYKRMDRKDSDALAICDEALKKYKDKLVFSQLKHIKEELLRTSINIELSKTFYYPDDTLFINASFRNVKSLSAVLSKDSVVVGRYDFDTSKGSGVAEAEQEFFINLPNEVGNYYIKYEVNGKVLEKHKMRFAVTRLLSTHTLGYANNLCIFVFDAKYGNPVEGATVRILNGDGHELKSVITDKDGYVTLPRYSEMYKYKVEFGDDKSIFSPEYNLNTYMLGRQEVSDGKKVDIITDRQFYRPGQDIYIKGIVTNTEDGVTKVVPNEERELKVGNSQKVFYTTKVTTNEFGSFNVKVTLPKELLNGFYDIIVSGERYAKQIRVDNYKLPTLEVKFDNIEGKYSANQNITVKGTAKLYNGVALGNAKVRYEVKKSSFQDFGFGKSKLVFSGITTTNDDGEFGIDFKLVADKGDEGEYSRFEVKAFVTDASGETVSAQKNVSVGTEPLYSQINILKKNKAKEMSSGRKEYRPYSTRKTERIRDFYGEDLDKDQPVELNVVAQNHDEVNIESTAEYKIIKHSDWKQKVYDKVLLSGELEANKNVKLDLSSLPCDRYVIMVKAKTKDNVYSKESVGLFSLFSTKENKSVVDNSLLLYAEDNKVNVNGKATLKIGTSDDEIKALITLFDNKGELRHKQYITVKRGIYSLELSDLQSYGKSAYVSVITAKNGMIYVSGLRLENEVKIKGLTAKWVVFRDKLSPKNKETWKMIVTDTDGNVVPAEVLATMYDASLNSLIKVIGYNNFGKKTTSSYYQPLWSELFMSNPSLHYLGKLKDRRESFSQMWDNLVFDNSKHLMKTRTYSAAADTEELVFVTGSVPKVRTYSVGATNRKEFKEDPNKVIRAELVETAFFLPELRTNSKGEVEFSFNSPQALTRWNFNAYAHTKDYETFILRDTVSTVKELMLMVNKPRFVRVGDEGRLSAKLINNSNERIEATVKLELISSETNEVLRTERKSVKIESRGNVEAEFTLNIKDMPSGALKCRVVADSKKFSDGEEFYIPVVSNTEVITKALTFLVEAGQTTKEDIGNLFIKDWKHSDNKSITVEVVSNPIWYAIMSMPTLQSTSDNALSMVAMLWGNGLTEGLVKQRPEIRDVFNAWITSGRKTNDGKSQLYMNGELRDILLENTPWLSDAQDEYTQRMNVAKAFDEARIQINKNYAVEKLLALQANDGSYSWFGKRGGSKAVTSLVLYGIDNYMDASGDVNNSPLRLVRNNIIQYLSKEMISWNDKYVKNKAKMTNAYLPQYLIISSISLSRGGTELVAGLKEANDNFMKVIGENVGKLSIEDRALYAIALNKQGKHKEAKNVLESIKQHLVQKKGLGAYFDSNLVRETKMLSHLHTMTALSLYEENKAVVAKMRQWLISNKRANKWGEDLNTAFAVSAIVNSVDKNSSLLSSDLEVTAGKHTIVSKQDDKNTQLGYTKKRIELSEMKDWVNDITIVNKGTNDAIVNVYSQYEAPILEVETFSFASKISRKAYVEKVEGDKRVNKLITPNTILEVGDKVVTYLTVLSDRDLSFVRVKEQRASNLEPVDKISGYRYSDGLWFYQELKDTHYNMFIDNLSKGEYVIKQEYRVTTRGKYQMGLVRLESVYAPEFVSHSKSFVINAAR